MNDVYDKVCRLSDEIKEVKKCVNLLHKKVKEQNILIKELYKQNVKLAKQKGLI